MSETRIDPEIQFPELKLDQKYAEGCPPGHMPFIVRPRDPRKIVFYSWSSWNPFPPRALFNKKLPRISDKCVGKGRALALVRLFGYTNATTKCKIPNFKAAYFPEGHLLKHDEVMRRLKEYKHSDYMSDDGATARSHALLWKAVFPTEIDDRSTEIICCERPGAECGEWVTPEEKAGDAQTAYAQYAIDDYKRLIRETESEMGLDVVRRKADPRGFSAEQMGNQGGLTFYELFARDGTDQDPILSPMFFEPAKCRTTISEDLLEAGKLVDLLACDWEQPITAMNRPHLLISDQCINTIHCWSNWDGTSRVAGGSANPYKDFVDCSRYLCDEATPFLDPGESRITAGAGW